MIMDLMKIAIFKNYMKRFLFSLTKDVKNPIGEALNGVQKSNPMPNSKLDIMECILSGFNSAII